MEQASSSLGPSTSGYNYVVTAQKPTAVKSSVVGHFTSPTDINLIISKCTRIEVHTLAEGLQGVMDVPIYGRVASMALLRPPGKEKDLLFFLTEEHHFSVVEFDATKGELITHAMGNASAKVGRINNNGIVGIVDPDCRTIALHIYDAIVKIIPIDEKGKLQEAFDVRIDEMNILDLKFLDGCERPTLAVLHEDAKSERHIKTYVVDARPNVKDFEDGPWKHNNLDNGANIIIAVPKPLCGAIVLGESVITYFNADQQKTVSLQHDVMTAYGKVDDNGSRYLLGDLYGRLHLLVLSHDNDRVLGLKLQALGRTSVASTISYLDNAVVFVGSTGGDSQLIRLHPEALVPEDPTNFVEVLNTFTNLGPIVDFCVVDLDRQGQGQVVTCSGIATDGSLRIVRNGIGMVGQATIELSGIRGLWSLRAEYEHLHDSFLVLTFVGETRLLAMNEEEELEEAEPEGFDADNQTLYCGNAIGKQIVQVTPKEIRLLSTGEKQLLHQWQPPSGMQINVAAGNPSQILLATGEGNLVYLEIAEGQIAEKGHLKLAADISCLSINPLDQGKQNSPLAAVGTWANTVYLFQLPGLTGLNEQALGGDVIPRSLLFASFEGVNFLLIALGDGKLFNFHINSADGALTDRKVISLGTKPISLHCFRSNNTSYVFAASDRPTIIYSNNQKLLYSNLNEDEVNFMTPFNSKSFPDSLAIAKEGSLTIGSIDEVQKLHIRTIPLGTQPRRLCHMESAKRFLLSTSPNTYESGLDDGSPDQLILMDDQTMEQVDRFELDPKEAACSTCTVSFADDNTVYFAVGTAFVLQDEPEPSKGRILIFSCYQEKLRLVAEKEINGGAMVLRPFQGKLIAGVSARVQVYKWSQKEDTTRELLQECSHTGHIMVLFLQTRGDFILVGDLMKSMNLLLYKPEEGTLEVRAQDYGTAFMTAVEILDDDTFLGSENSYNLFTVRKNSDAASDEERRRLQTIGEYHLGDFVNRFTHGSLVMQTSDTESARIPTVLFGTINGVVGVIASLPPDLYNLLESLQNAMKKVVKGVGGLSHSDWRAFRDQRVHGRPCSNFIDGDLVEQYLDLRQDQMQTIVDQIGGSNSTDELGRTVEELSRALH